MVAAATEITASSTQLQLACSPAVFECLKALLPGLSSFQVQDLQLLVVNGWFAQNANNKCDVVTLTVLTSTYLPSESVVTFPTVTTAALDQDFQLFKSAAVVTIALSSPTVVEDRVTLGVVAPHGLQAACAKVENPRERIQVVADAYDWIAKQATDTGFVLPWKPVMMSTMSEEDIQQLIKEAQGLSKKKAETKEDIGLAAMACCTVM